MLDVLQDDTKLGGAANHFLAQWWNCEKAAFFVLVYLCRFVIKVHANKCRRAKT